MVDWYYIFSILLLGIYPCSPDIYNVVQFLHLFCFPEISSTLTFPLLPTSRILLRLALRDYGGQVAPAYAKASAGKHSVRR